MNTEIQVYDSGIDLQNPVFMIKSKESEGLKIHRTLVNRTRFGSIGENQRAVQRKGQIPRKAQSAFYFGLTPIVYVLIRG